MKAYRLDEMKKNCFIGDFLPSAVKTDKIECSIKECDASLRLFRYRNVNYVFVVLEGAFYTGERAVSKGQMIWFKPGEEIFLKTIDHVKYLQIKFPRIKGGYKELEIYEDEIHYYNLFMEHRKVFADAIKNFHIPGKESLISRDQLSILIHGKVDIKWLELSIYAYRLLFPESQLIISTWSGTDLSSVNVDRVVISKDPGGQVCGTYNGSELLNNVNRQLVPIKNGLNAVNNPYVLVVRSDFLPLGDNIPNCFRRSGDEASPYKVFSDPVVIGDLFSRTRYEYETEEGANTIPTPFHPSDWFMLGNTDDIRMIFDNNELLSDEELGNYSCKHPERREEYNYPFNWRYAPEQAMIMGLVRKKFPEVNFEDWSDWDEKNIEISEQFMRSNYVVVGFEQYQLMNIKHRELQYGNMDGKAVIEHLIRRNDYEG